MLVRKNVLLSIRKEDIVNGVFTAPDYVYKIGDKFEIRYPVKKIILPNVVSIGNMFLYENYTVESIIMPNVVEIGISFLFSNSCLTELEAPSLKVIGTSFLFSNISMKNLDLQNVVEISSNFMAVNLVMDKINLPNVKKIGKFFLYSHNNFKYSKVILNALSALYVSNRLIPDKDTYIRNTKIKKLLK